MEVTATMLSHLDLLRRASGEPSARGRVVREWSPDRAECRIVYSHCNPGDVDDAIREEVSAADAGGYQLEWKLYGRDRPPDLADRLRVAGFVPGAVESVLALPVTKAAVAAFAVPEDCAPGFEVRRIRDADGLADAAEVAREIGRGGVEEERWRLAAALRDAPGTLSVYVAYVDGQPVASGRIHFPPDTDVAELAGGRTRTTHRRRGLFTAIVAARLREALARDRRYVYVDALSTSEPILRRRGFQLVTHTQPFVYEPGSRP